MRSCGCHAGGRGRSIDDFEDSRVSILLWHSDDLPDLSFSVSSASSVVKCS